MREITKELYSTTLSNDEFENLCSQVFSKKNCLSFSTFFNIINLPTKLIMLNSENPFKKTGGISIKHLKKKTIFSPIRHLLSNLPCYSKSIKDYQEKHRRFFMLKRIVSDCLIFFSLSCWWKRFF